MRRAKIVATLGPATSSYEQIRAVIDAGVDVARMNLSHGTYDDHERVYASLHRDANVRSRRHHGVITNGPIEREAERLGHLRGGLREIDLDDLPRGLPRKISRTGTREIQLRDPGRNAAKRPRRADLEIERLEDGGRTPLALTVD